VTFEVVPAVDVSRGRLARLTRSGPVPLEAFGGDPLAAARAFVAAGARRLHLVDMDRALGSGPGDDELLRRVAELGVPVQASGGIVVEEEATRILDAGAERVVLSSRALADRAAFERLVRVLGGSAVAGLELDGARIRPRGAAEIDLDVTETTVWLAATAAQRYLVTDLGRLGERTGPDLVHLRWLAMRLRRPLLAAGGISSPEDVRSLDSIGLEGAVVGSALFGDVALEELIRAAGG
jgi:phosphoribosylformimino-5-aminoimidazole carboxamide ribonucleotide (ProFAR) isomerase